MKTQRVIATEFDKEYPKGVGYILWYRATCPICGIENTFSVHTHKGLLPFNTHGSVCVHFTGDIWYVGKKTAVDFKTINKNGYFCTIPIIGD